MKEVLQAVHDRTGIQSGILRVSSLQSNLGGKIAVARARLLVDASIAETNESGYPAMLKLLSIKEGSFAYLDAGAAEYKGSLNVAIESLLSVWPRFPDSPSDVFDERSLLDEVFGAKNRTLPESAPQAMPQEPPQQDVQPAPSLGLFKPISGEPARLAPDRSLLLGATSWLPEEEPESRITFGKLRAHSGGMKNDLLWPAIILVVILLLAGLGLVVVNNYNSAKAPVSQQK